MKLFDIFETINVEKNISLYGMTDDFFGALIANKFTKNKNNYLIVTSTLYEANMLYKIISNYSDKVYLFPMDDFITSQAISVSPEMKLIRLKTLDDISENDANIIITNLEGFIKRIPSKNIYYDSYIDIKVGSFINIENLKSKLIDLGYIRETFATATGEFAVRGFIIDVFGVDFDNPIRIEFFGDQIESIRTFDENTQITIKKLDRVTIKPNVESVNQNESSIINFLNNPTLIIKNYNQVLNAYKKLSSDIFEFDNSKSVNDYYYDFFDITNRDFINYDSVDNYKKSNDSLLFNIKPIEYFNENIDKINDFLLNALYNNKTVVICLKKYQIKSFTSKLKTKFIETNENNIEFNSINIIEKNIDKGFLYEDLVLIGSVDLFKNQNVVKKGISNYKYSSKINNINKLEVGDYVVHYSHGIGIYNGIKTLKKGDNLNDYIEVLYQGKDKIYIPVEKIDLITKYVGKDGSAPKINKLSGNDWEKTKAKIRMKTQDIANHLLELYAKREKNTGFAFSKDSDMQKSFEDEFSYKLTIDQVKATLQVKEDMEKPVPMDRLLCGDVGFGKTEVALRAIFKAVMDSKQVLLLCPTTILSSQHYETALARFANYPINVALLNRFTSARRTQEIKRGINDGTIDVLIGTHRLLGKDIIPHDLGLLVIDEEQRFGVLHKEKIKEFKNSVDVLTLSATPIPRTLQMSLVGIRSLSLIETPPVNRYPVQTYVIEENRLIIKEVIYKELSRGGQCFVLYNNIEFIEKFCNEINELVPEARMVFAHGRLPKEELEEKMNGFIKHEFDIMVCTTIIETGIDIPNANTLIVIDADRFGLAQLYQLRGRVGRSDRIAYSYFMYKPQKSLNESAIKRLDAIKTFTQLGSGFALASRDLAIRGAGDVLGQEQAGFIDSVGIDLYLRILDEEVNKLKGIKTEEEEASMIFDVDTHINDDYVSEDEVKIEIHKLIDTIDSKEKYEKVKNQIIDRFGRINEKIDLYMHEKWLEKLISKYQVEKVNKTKISIELIFTEEFSKKIDSEKLFMDVFNITRDVKFRVINNRLAIFIDIKNIINNYVYTLIEILSTLSYLD